MKDIKFLTPGIHTGSLSITGKTQNIGQILLQKVMLLMLTNSNQIYRQDYGTQLMEITKGSNCTSTLLQQLSSQAIAQIKQELQDEDLQQLEQISARVVQNHLLVTVTTVQGTTYQGVVA